VFVVWADSFVVGLLFYCVFCVLFCVLFLFCFFFFFASTLLPFFFDALGVSVLFVIRPLRFRKFSRVSDFSIFFFFSVFSVFFSMFDDSLLLLRF
jgi:hypothetical protein